MADDDVSREGQPVDDSWLEFYLFSYGIFVFFLHLIIHSDLILMDNQQNCSTSTY